MHESPDIVRVIHCKGEYFHSAVFYDAHFYSAYLQTILSSQVRKKKKKIEIETTRLPYHRNNDEITA